MIWDFLFLRCIHAFTDTLVFLPIFAKGSAFLVLSGAACFPLFSMGMLPAFFPWLVRFSLTFAEDLHLPLKLWYLADALIDLGIGHLGPFRCKLCMSMRFQKISGESTTGRKSTCFFRKVEIQLLRYGDLQHNSKCPNLEFAPLNGIKFVTKGSKYMGESCCSYWFCSQSYYVLGTSIR